MKTSLRSVIIILVAIWSAFSISALDLPSKKINGTDQYYYAVKRGDDIYSIAAKLGVSPDDIVRYNPSAADGVRQGMTIYLPVKEFANVKSPAAATEAAGRPANSFRYQVKKGETVFGLSHRFGLTPEDIIACNPGANDGIKAGEYLIIPGSEPQQPAATNPGRPASAPAEKPAKAPAITEVAEVTEVTEAAEPAPEQGITEVSVQQVELAQPTGNIAILLPLMLDSESPSKQAQLYTDFARGILLGAKEMQASAGDVHISIYDTKGDKDVIQRLMADPAVATADVIVTSEDETSLRTVESSLGDGDAYIFNIMAVQDTTYLTNPAVMQANIPHRLMYAKAVEAMTDMFDGYTPVFLICKGGRSEKIAFTDYAREQFMAAGIAPLDITFEGVLSQRDLEDLDPEGKYVFIPGSGALSEFNKFARALMTYRDARIDPSDIALFGYPDWTIFRNDAAEMLHNLEAVFYSRFYSNPTLQETTDFTRAFTAAFGAEPMQVVPSQAMLGYDTARYLITNIRTNGGVIDPEFPAEYIGLQSAFRFEEAADSEENTAAPAAISGPVNTALIIINYMQGNGVATRVL